MNVQLEYIDQTFAIMLALCQHNAATYYAQNYAGIIGASLAYILQQETRNVHVYKGVKSTNNIIIINIFTYLRTFTLIQQ